MQQTTKAQTIFPDAVLMMMRLSCRYCFIDSVSMKFVYVMVLPMNSGLLRAGVLLSEYCIYKEYTIIICYDHYPFIF